MCVIWVSVCIFTKILWSVEWMKPNNHIIWNSIELVIFCQSKTKNKNKWKSFSFFAISNAFGNKTVEELRKREEAAFSLHIISPNFDSHFSNVCKIFLIYCAIHRTKKYLSFLFFIFFGFKLNLKYAKMVRKKINLRSKTEQNVCARRGAHTHLFAQWFIDSEWEEEIQINILYEAHAMHCKKWKCLNSVEKQ